MISNRTILCGDVLEKLKEIPSESIDCIISSPPYWGLRSYGMEDEWGREPDFRDFMKKLHSLMVELKRTVKDTGSIWINLGDTYFSSKLGSARPTGLHGDNCSCGTCTSRSPNNFKPVKSTVPEGSRCLIPSRFAIDCVDNLQLLLRNDIIWNKPNSIPDSVESKLPNTWEPIFFFAKNKKCYLDVKSIEIISATKMFETKRQKDMLTIPVKKFHGSHTATFPEELIEKIVKVACPANGMVLDPFLGSGTVGAVAEKFGREWCGIELNPEYIKIAEKRLEKFRNQTMEAFA